MSHCISDNCTMCGACDDMCPVEAIVTGERWKVDAAKCIDCGACVDECPVSAIQPECKLSNKCGNCHGGGFVLPPQE